MMITRTLLVALSLACLEITFLTAGAVMLLFRLEYKTSVICHNVNTQSVKIARRDRPHISAVKPLKTFWILKFLQRGELYQGFSVHSIILNDDLY